MRALNYFQVNTYSTKPFAGNTVAVISQAMGLSDQEMYKIAAELNLPHTVFILPSIELARAHSRLRHFNRAGEIQFDVNTTMASVWVMIKEHWLPLPANGSYFSRIEQTPTEMIPVEIQCHQGNNYSVMLSSELPALEKPSSQVLEAFRNILELCESDIDIDLTILCNRQSRYLIIPVKDKESLFKIKLNPEMLVSFYQEFQYSCLPLVVTHSEDIIRIFLRCLTPPDERVSELLRFSASATACSYFYEYGLPSKQDGSYEIYIEQRNINNRQGKYFCELLVQNGLATNLKIGGTAVVSMTGKIILDE